MLTIIDVFSPLYHTKLNVAAPFYIERPRVNNLCWDLSCSITNRAWLAQYSGFADITQQQRQQQRVLLTHLLQPPYFSFHRGSNFEFCASTLIGFHKLKYISQLDNNRVPAEGFYILQQQSVFYRVLKFCSAFWLSQAQIFFSVLRNTAHAEGLYNASC